MTNEEILTLESLMNIEFGLLKAAIKTNPGLRIEDLLQKETTAGE